VFFLTLSLKSRDPVWEADVPLQADSAATADAVAGTGNRAPGPGEERAPGAGNRADAAASLSDTTTQQASGAAEGPRRYGVFVVPRAAGDTAESGLDIEVNTGSARLDSLLLLRMRRLSRMPREEAASALISGLLQRAPTMMFLMLPLFALMLQVLHLGSGRYYVEHFVFALHYHAFAFLLYTLMLALDAVAVVPGLLALWVFLYLPIAMKRVYGHGWIVTTVKWIVLGTGYITLIAFGLIATLLVTAVLL
jgi:hypothetical protein